MIIRKKSKFEGAHIVRNCSSERCKKSIHGHSYIVEIFLEAKKLDNGGMVVDFGLLKGPVKDLIDSFDHCYAIWDKESTDYKEFIRRESARWIEMPVSPSAENFAVVLFKMIDDVLKNTEFVNNEDPGLKLKSVRVHETETGYAEADRKDLKRFQKILKGSGSGVTFSEAIQEEWSNPEMISQVIFEEKFINPKVEITHG